MRKKLIVLTPLPQFRFGSKALARVPSRFKIGKTISIQPLRPRLRRELLDVAKIEKPTDDLLMLLNESELVFIAGVPARRHKGSQDNIVFPFFYSLVASEILNRLHKCFLLFGWVPAPLFMACWFSGRASAKYATITETKLLNPRWKYLDQFTNLDWRSPTVEPVDIAYQYFMVHGYWAKLSRVCHVDHLVKIFTDPNKEKELIKSANEYVEGKAADIVRPMYGPDTVIERSGTKGASRGPKTSGDGDRGVKLGKLSSKWFIEGLAVTMNEELEKISEKLHTNPSKNRLARAFQFFCEAFPLAEPHRFVSLAVCLETLFCTRRTEILLQIAGRLSWLLEPGNDCKHRALLKETKQVYNLRSKIVHGGSFSISEIETGEERLIDLCRQVFWKILSDDRLFDTFFNKDPKVCDEYLDSLNLGSPGLPNS